jgi:hypothetical protein
MVSPAVSSRKTGMLATGQRPGELAPALLSLDEARPERQSELVEGHEGLPAEGGKRMLVQHERMVGQGAPFLGSMKLVHDLRTLLQLAGEVGDRAGCRWSAGGAGWSGGVVSRPGRVATIWTMEMTSTATVSRRSLLGTSWK